MKSVMNSNIVNSPDVLDALQQRKRRIKRKLENSRTQMTDNVSYLTGGKMPATTDRVQKIARLLINGLVIYRGFRLFLCRVKTVFPYPCSSAPLCKADRHKAGYGHNNCRFFNEAGAAYKIYSFSCFKFRLHNAFILAYQVIDDRHHLLTKDGDFTPRLF